MKASEKIENLDLTLDAHFKAIADRNLESLLKTVNEESITLILPNGKYSTSFSDYKNVNREWFKDQDWSIEYKLIEKTVRQETAIVLTKINYQDKDEKGNDYSFEYFLTLVFGLKESGWKLIFDQNTIIK